MSAFAGLLLVILLALILVFMALLAGHVRQLIRKVEEDASMRRSVEDRAPRSPDPRSPEMIELRGMMEAVRDAVAPREVPCACDACQGSGSRMEIVEPPLWGVIRKQIALGQSREGRSGKGD